MSIEVTENKEVILDPSLLTVGGFPLLSDLLQEDNLRFIVTQEMKDYLGKDDVVKSLVIQWGEAPVNIPLVLQLIRTSELLYRPQLETRKIGDNYYFYKDIVLNLAIRFQINDDENIAGFMADEMALALDTRTPILCISSSPTWKIVEFFGKVGAQLRGTISIQFDRKVEFVGMRGFWKQVIAAGLGTAFVFAVASPIVGAVYGATSAITIIVAADP